MGTGPARSIAGLSLAALAALLLTALLPGRRTPLLRDEGLPSPELSVSAGRLHHEVAGDPVVRYTLDGSEPDAQDPVLEQDLLLQHPGPSHLLTIPTSVQWRHPVGDFPAMITVRARAFREGRAGPSSVLSIPSGTGSSLPLISLVLPEGAFFDPDSGIYVVGNAVLRDDPEVRRDHQRSNKWWRYPGNFHGRGKAWERAAHWEYFLPRSERAASAAPVRLRINGNNTRGFAQHALRLLFEEPLGAADPFAAISGAGHRSLLLRASGNDQDRTFFRDGLQHRLCAGLSFETSAQRQCVVYVNGAYWGLHNLRERLDAKEIARRHGLKPKQVTLLADGLELYEGDRKEVDRFSRFLTLSEQWDAAAPGFVDSVERRLDVDGFLHYMAAQIILGNVDWPGQNVRWWRFTGAADTIPGARDGRWRFIMGDSDIGFGLSTGADVDLFARLEGSPAPTARLFRACLRSPVLAQRFGTILRQLASGPLSAERMRHEAEAMRDEIAREMAVHVRRWRRPLTFERWNAHVAELMIFADARTEQVVRQFNARCSASARPSNTSE